MGCFDIDFCECAVKSRSEFLTTGRIQIGDFVESFETSLHFWTVDDYRSHWRSAIKRLVDGRDKSGLITSIHDPKKSSFLVWWPCYRVGDQIVFQNQWLFFEQLPEPFDLAHPYRSVDDREIGTEDSPISEWTAPIAWLVEFIHRKFPE